MLYKKNYLSTLSDELFRSPTSEYRAAPFWAWNCKLEEDELLRQIEIFHEMGFGGFHMHVRTGMDTEYLSDEFMHLIRSCTDKAKSEKCSRGSMTRTDGLRRRRRNSNKR